MLEASDNAVDEIANPALFIKLLKSLKALVYGNANPMTVCLKYLLAALDEQGYRNSYDGGGKRNELLHNVQYSTLDALSDAEYSDIEVISALKSVCRECEYHFDKRLISAELL